MSRDAARSGNSGALGQGTFDPYARNKFRGATRFGEPDLGDLGRSDRSQPSPFSTHPEDAKLPPKLPYPRGVCATHIVTAEKPCRIVELLEEGFSAQPHVTVAYDPSSFAFSGYFCARHERIVFDVNIWTIECESEGSTLVEFNRSEGDRYAWHALYETVADSCGLKSFPARHGLSLFQPPPLPADVVATSCMTEMLPPMLRMAFHVYADVQQRGMQQIAQLSDEESVAHALLEYEVEAGETAVSKMVATIACDKGNKDIERCIMATLANVSRAMIACPSPRTAACLQDNLVVLAQRADNRRDLDTRFHTVCLLKNLERCHLLRRDDEVVQILKHCETIERLHPHASEIQERMAGIPAVLAS